MELLQLIVYGIVVGGIFSLGAIGVSLIFGILRFANFSHGDLMTLGAYYAFTCVIVGLPLVVAFVVAIVITAV